MKLFCLFLKIFATILSSLWETLISKNDMKHNGNILKKCLQNKYSVSSLILLQLSILELDASILQKWARNAERYFEYYWKNWTFKKHCFHNKLEGEECKERLDKRLHCSLGAKSLELILLQFFKYRHLPTDLSPNAFFSQINFTYVTVPILSIWIVTKNEKTVIEWPFGMYCTLHLL